MTDEALMKAFKSTVEVHGAARIAVALNYRDTRPINAWLANKTIPKARIELVKRIIKELSSERIIIRRRKGQEKTAD